MAEHSKSEKRVGESMMSVQLDGYEQFVVGKICGTDEFVVWNGRAKECEW